MKIGVVADDITGANDIGICFVNGGARVVIYTFADGLAIRETDADVVIIDTDSRFDSAEDSYRKAYRATEMLQEWGADRFHNKTCSVFRGNIGPEFDAMQDALGLNRACVVLGFPKNGRTTVEGIHYVNGVELAQTHFANDPIHPMGMSSLIEILSAQTARAVASISHAEYTDPDTLRQKIKDSSGYLIFDVRDDADIAYLAELLKDEINLCGSSAIAEYWPKALSLPRAKDAKNTRPNSRTGVLVLAGSLTPQTAQQITYAAGYMPCVMIDTELLMAMDSRSQAHEKAILDSAVQAITHNENIAVYTANTPEAVSATRDAARQRNMDDKAVGRYLSGFLATIAETVNRECGLSRFIALGGDTSAAIAKRLGINKMYVAEEIEVGVPTLTGGEDGQYYFTLKSGSFGSESFIMKAIRRLHEDL